MDELFNILSSSTRIDKSKRKKKIHQNTKKSNESNEKNQLDNNDLITKNNISKNKDHSIEKLEWIHNEEVSAFRRRMNIQIRKSLTSSSSSTISIPDPISSFDEVTIPSWWEHKIWKDKKFKHTFSNIKSSVYNNIKSGKWINPTPIQMQAIPSILNRRDTLGCAPTGSGKSGAFLIPILFLSSVEEFVFYGTECNNGTTATATATATAKTKKNQMGHIRSLVLAPSRELAQQLHRELERLGEGKMNGLRTALLSKSNSAVVSTLGGKSGLDVLVTTPLRLVDAMEQRDPNRKKGVDLSRVRVVVLDEADRLLDAKDGVKDLSNDESKTYEKSKSISGSVFGKTFLEQMDTILSAIPETAVRALFSATIGSSVRQLSESILRNPIDITISSARGSTIANSDITQKLIFVGREEGKLLAIREIIQKGIHPPVIVFLQSKDRAQALFSELLYDGVNVDVIHAGRSQGARDRAITKFRKGETWILICTDLVARGVDFKAVNMVINYDLPGSAVTYVHRIGRTGRAGRKGEAITLYTESDFEHIGTIANVMKLSGCTDIPDWVLNAKKKKMKIPPKRARISTTLSKKKQKK